MPIKNRIEAAKPIDSASLMHKGMLMPIKYEGT
jgi:hypothetical protein